MLRLRKILLCKYMYYIIFLLAILYTFIFINSERKSIIDINTHEFYGVITKIIKKDNSLRLYLKNKETIIANYYIKDKKVNLHLGDSIKVEGDFKIPNRNTTKYLFNYREYLKRQGIYYSMKVNSYKILKKNYNIFYLLKERLIKRFSNNPYLYTFILGDKSYLNDKVKRSYQENGISHLFAISGMHITLLVQLIDKLLGRFIKNKKKVFIITIFILLLYWLFVGNTTSMFRGILFYILFTINKEYYFYVGGEELCILILSISLFVNPYNCFDVGFLYSYVISYFLLLLGDMIQDKNYFKSLLKASLLSFLVGLPISLYSFQQINIGSIFYNLFFVPFVSVIIFPFSLVVLLFPFLNNIFLVLISVLENVSLLLNKIYFGKIVFMRLPFIVYIIYFVLLLLFGISKKKVFLCLFFFCLLIHFLIPYFDQSDYIEMIDVGQGDSFLIHSNGKSMLIDTGGIMSYDGKSKTSVFYQTTYPLLKSLGIRKLDYLVLTHGDYDHLGDSLNLLDKIKVDKVFVNEGKFNYLERAVIKRHGNVEVCREGTYFELGDFKMYSINHDLGDENSSSIVLYVEYSKYKMLFMGDANFNSEEYILNNYDLVDVDILKLGHHGSKYSSSEGFLDEVNPKIALVSAGKNNKFKHPNRETLLRLKKYYTKIYRTDRDGSVTLRFNNSNLKIEKYIS